VTIARKIGTAEKLPQYTHVYLPQG